MAGDDTDGHIDQLARFVGPRTVVASVELEPSEENYEPLADNVRRLKKARSRRPSAGGRHAADAPARYFNNQRLPAGYANFYIANGVVVVPTFGDPADEIAPQRFRDCSHRGESNRPGASIWSGASARSTA